MSECESETSIMKRPWHTMGCRTIGGEGGRKAPVQVTVLIFESVRFLEQESTARRF